MSKLDWPQVETERPYKLHRVQVPARPLPDIAPLPVHLLDIGGASRPRRCIGPLTQLPDGPVYWCRSCDRRVANANQPFCKRHKKLRDRYTRELRETERKPVPVRREDLRTLHHLAQTVETQRARVLSAETSEEFRRAWLPLNETLMEFEHFVRGNLPDGAVNIAVPGRPTPEYNEPPST